MQQHPIDNMMQTTMENIRSMVDVNTVVGAPVTGTKGTTIIPISKVSFGFIAGGGEYAADESRSRSLANEGFPFAGGTGAWRFWADRCIFCRSCATPSSARCT